MKTQIAITRDDGILSIGAWNGLDDYCLWQIEEDDQKQSYFEYNDQLNSGYNIKKECSLMSDGMHLVLTSGDQLHFYFNNLSRSNYRDFLEAIENIFTEYPDVLDVIDK